MWRLSPNARSVVAAALALSLTALAGLYARQLDNPRPPAVRVQAVGTLAPSTSTPPTTVAPRPPDRPSRAEPRAAPRILVSAPVYGVGACGGDLPPCWVLARESRGNIRAVNPRGCGGRGCFGKWQFDPKTWLGCWARRCDGLTYQGFGRADEAPESVQDDRAREVWNRGAGCGQWDAC